MAKQKKIVGIVFSTIKNPCFTSQLMKTHNKNFASKNTHLPIPVAKVICYSTKQLQATHLGPDAPRRTEPWIRMLLPHYVCTPASRSESLLVGQQCNSSTWLEMGNWEEPTSKNERVKQTCEEKRSMVPNLNHTATSKTRS